MKYPYSYLISLQFLGFRFHGWQKQLDQKTVHQMVDKTLRFVIDDAYKSLGVGRTDAKVSASQYLVQLFTATELPSSFLSEFQSNLPPDIFAESVESVPRTFNLIQHPKTKIYGYFFSFGTKNHPFSAPFIYGIAEELNLEKMQEGAKIFEGYHWFHKYCTKPSANTNFYRQIIRCEVVENTLLKANFFPEKSYVLRISGTGFLRYQVRLIMGELIALGKGDCTIEDLKASLHKENDRKPLKSIAPSSGLQLLQVTLD
ncbi:tRNA pseudouridine(38-40) synthase TruA [Flavobacteriaceae bacterium F08102]|nr:tRNA pseudouridine(38-40) synthase TruA [Flavobacteriaceae bacterium F08102]